MKQSADFSKLRAMSTTELELWARQLRHRWVARTFPLLSDSTRPHHRAWLLGTAAIEHAVPTTWLSL